MSRFSGEDAERLNDPDSWDEDDIRYLRDRNRLPAGYKLPASLRPSAPSVPSIDDQPNLGDAGLIPDPTGMNPSLDDPDPVVFDDDVDSMDKSELQDAARNRGLDDGGTVKELKERIKKFDTDLL